MSFELKMMPESLFLSAVQLRLENLPDFVIMGLFFTVYPEQQTLNASLAIRRETTACINLLSITWRRA